MQASQIDSLADMELAAIALVNDLSQGKVPIALYFRLKQ